MSPTSIRMIPQALCASLATLALAFATPLAAEQSAEGKLYRCRDSKGVTSYQQEPCGKHQTAAGEVAYSADPAAAAAAPVAPVPPAAPPAAPAPDAAPPPEAPAPAPTPPPAAPPERVSDAVECLRPDSSTYVRSGQCELSEVGGDPFEGYVTDEKTGERKWVQGETPRRQVRDPARPLTRSEACRLAGEQISRSKTPGDGAAQLLRDAESVRERNCD